MPFGLSLVEAAFVLVMLALVVALFAWIGWILVETVRRFLSELDGPVR